MAVLASGDYQTARERLQSNPIVAMMAAGLVTVPLAELAHEDGTPRSDLMNHANRAFDDADARNAANPAYQPYPKDAHRHLGLIAEAVLADRTARDGCLRDGFAWHPSGVGLRDLDYWAAAGRGACRGDRLGGRSDPRARVRRTRDPAPRGMPPAATP